MATAVARIADVTEPAQASLWSDAWRRLRRNPVAIVALVLGLAVTAGLRQRAADVSAELDVATTVDSDVLAHVGLRLPD